MSQNFHNFFLLLDQFKLKYSIKIKFLYVKKYSLQIITLFVTLTCNNLSFVKYKNIDDLINLIKMLHNPLLILIILF